MIRFTLYIITMINQDCEVFIVIFNIQNATQAFSDLISPQSNETVKTNITPEMCQKCKGACCKRMGCEIAPRQVIGISKTNSIETNTDIILKILRTGIVSVDWWIGECDNEYYLRMRNKNAPVIDPSWGGECMCLTETGYMLDAHYRPLAGLELTCEECNGEFRPKDNGHYTKESCKDEWLEYPIDWNRIVYEEDFEFYDQIKLDTASTSSEVSDIRSILEFLKGL